jgi:AraC-like DNA-binding protein/quercetin dioxygenase-like cupin family protein
MPLNRQTQRPDIPRSLIRPVEVRAFDMSDGETFQPHSHKWGQFTYSAKGVLTVLTAEGHFSAPPAMAVWIPPGVTHDIRPVGPAKFRSLYIEENLVQGMPEACVVLAVDLLLRNLILEATRLPRNWDVTGSDHRLMMVIVDRIRCASPAPLHLPLPSSHRLRAVTNSLLADPTDRRTIDQHGSNVGASGRTLARLFKQETGMTFGEWRRQRVLLAALELLADGATVTTVALEMGYESTSAFIAMFRQSLGMTPTQYIASR